MQERDNCRSQCKAGRLVLDRSRDGSLLVRGERPYGHQCTWVSRFAGGAGGGGRRWKLSSDCFYYLSEIRNVVIIYGEGILDIKDGAMGTDSRNKQVGLMELN